MPNDNVLSGVPARSLAELEHQTSLALAQSAQNAVLMQMLGNVVMISATAAGVARILNKSPASVFDQLEADARAAGIPV